MSRILFFVLIIAVIYFAWAGVRRKQIQLEKRLDQQERTHKEEGPIRQREHGQHMVSCAHCGLYVPEQEAVKQSGKYYCCREHAELGPKDHR